MTALARDPAVTFLPSPLLSYIVSLTEVRHPPMSYADLNSPCMPSEAAVTLASSANLTHQFSRSSHPIHLLAVGELEFFLS